MDKEKIPMIALVVMRDSIHDEVEKLGEEFRKLLEPVIAHVTDDNSGLPQKSYDLLKESMAGLSLKMIDFINAVVEIEKLADSALEGMGAGEVKLTALVMDKKNGKIVTQPVRKSDQKNQDKKPKGFKSFVGKS